jgi:hypothetical protein
MPPPKKAAAKPKAAPKKAAKSVVVVSDDEADHKGTVRPPRKEFTGKDKSLYPNWRRSAFVWKNNYPKASAKQLGAALMEVVVDDAEDTVYGCTGEGEETFDNIIKALDGPYGEKQLSASTQYVQQFKVLKRGKKSLQDFLAIYTTARQKAIRFGWTPSPDTDGMDLIMACEITSTQQAGVLQTLQLKAEMLNKEFVRPEYATAYSALDTLASTLAMQDTARGVEKRPAGLLSSTEPAKRQRTWEPPKGPGKGLTTAPKGPGKGKGVCNQFAQAGKCLYGEACRFRHVKGGKDGKKGDGKGTKGPGGKPKATAPCRLWAKDGTCTYGDGCRFSHT